MTNLLSNSREKGWDHMDAQKLIRGIDEEIARLEQVRALLCENGFSKPQSGRRRTLTPEGREKIAAAQRKRWAKVPRHNSGSKSLSR
jgi:hypothetical protein